MLRSFTQGVALISRFSRLPVGLLRTQVRFPHTKPTGPQTEIPVHNGLVKLKHYDDLTQTAKQHITTIKKLDVAPNEKVKYLASFLLQRVLASHSYIENQGAEVYNTVLFELANQTGGSQIVVDLLKAYPQLFEDEAVMAELSRPYDFFSQQQKVVSAFFWLMQRGCDDLPNQRFVRLLSNNKTVVTQKSVCEALFKRFPETHGIYGNYSAAYFMSCTSQGRLTLLFWIQKYDWLKKPEVPETLFAVIRGSAAQGDSIALRFVKAYHTHEPFLQLLDENDIKCPPAISAQKPGGRVRNIAVMFFAKAPEKSLENKAGTSASLA